MKKLFTTLALGLSLCAFAQTPTYWNTTYFSPCQAATNAVTPHISAVPGLSPSDSALPCAVTGTFVSDTIYFHNFVSFSGLNVNYLKIDSLYLPAGLCWSTNKANNQFSGGEDGVILVQGNLTAPQGQYKMRIIVDANAGPNGVVNLTNQVAEALAHLRYRVRVLNSTYCPCPALNTTDTTDAFIAYTCAVGVGVNEIASEISTVSVVPNPFSHTATLSFNAENQGTYTVKMTNLIGAVVSTKEVNVVAGKNDIAIERNGLSTGIYLLSITNGQSALTKKVIIE